MAFAEGTRVWLINGSPEMTVQFKTHDGYYICNWFVGTTLNEHQFSEKQLTTTTPSKPKRVTKGVYNNNL